MGEVVTGFRSSLDGSTVYVYDNGSSDETALRAREAGAVVRTEASPGKGGVVRRMFSEVDADIYVIADGDGTYDPAEAPLLVKQLVSDQLDMVVASRIGVTGRAGSDSCKVPAWRAPPRRSARAHRGIGSPFLWTRSDPATGRARRGARPCCGPGCVQSGA